MVKFKTNIEVELFDKRQKSLGSHVIRLIVNSINATISGITAAGFYYYNVDGQDVVLDPFGTPISWEQVQMAETQLPSFDPQHLKEAFIQRIIEFTFIQQQIEDGENFGTTYTNWVRDEEYDEMLRVQNEGV